MNSVPDELLVLFCDLSTTERYRDFPAYGNQRQVFNTDEAFQVLDDDRFDFNVLVVRTDSRQGEAIDFLCRVRSEFPGVVRILISDAMNAQLASRATEVAHRSLKSDYTDDQLVASIQRGVKTEQLLGDPKLRQYIMSLGHLPSFPQVLNELNQALAKDTTGAREVSMILEKDPTMVAKILQMVNSSFFNLGNANFYSLKEAVSRLGMRTIKDLVLTEHLFQSLNQNERWRGFSFQQLHERSMIVSQFAAEICRLGGYDNIVQGQARLAGLLHDIGMLVLALGDQEKYHHAMVRAQELGQPVYVVEKLVLGSTHAQTGAYLLETWNLSPEIVNAVLFHHVPVASGDRHFTPLTAVHVADSLLPPLFNAMGCNLGGRLSRDYLREIDMLHALPEWEMMAHDIAYKMK